LYFYLKQYALARQVFQEAYKLARRKRWPKKQYYARVRLAELMVIEGQYESAREVYREFINFLQREGSLLECAYWTGRLADAYKQEGRDELAKAAYMQAYEMAKQARSKAYMPWYLIRAANIEASTGNIAAAIQKCNVASEIDTSKGNIEIWVELYLTLGNAYKNDGDFSKAILFYSRAAHLIEEARQNIAIEQLRVGYFSAWCEVYRRLVQCFLERYEKTGNRADLDSLFYYDEMGRSRALQDLQFRAGANTPSRSDSHLDQEYLKACMQLRLMQRRLRQEAEKIRPAEEWNHLLAQLEAARFSLVAQRLRLVKDDSTSSHIRNEPMRHLSAVLQNLKRADLGLLQYHISNEAAFVLAAAGDSARIVRLSVQPSSLTVSIDSLTAPFHVVGDGSPDQLPFRAAIAHRLYRSLVEPAEAVLKLPPRLLVVPDLALTNLPFEMLLVKPPEKAAYTPSDFPGYAEDFLLHRYRIVYSPSTSTLQERPAAVSPDAKLLVLANPFANTIGQKVNRSRLRAATGWSFDPLPFSEAEAKSIAEIYPSAHVYRRDNATKTRFMQEASQQQMVHIASHAFVDTTFDAFSGLVLATGPDSTDDGILMGYEIPDLNLNCDLITLSACETGRGKLVAGEGVLGLPRLLLRAGAKTVLMTLWKVDDKFASELMPEFYVGLLKKKLSKTDALGEAKLAMLRQTRAENGYYYQHPFYWASFVLYGDPGVNGRSSMPAAKWIVAFFVVLLLFVALPRYALRQRS
jgi:CHAT domain-containing protein